MAAGLQRVKLAVEGMSCASCERKVEAALRRLDGVREARASAPLAEVTVAFDPRQAGAEALREAVARPPATRRPTPPRRRAPAR